MSETSYQGRTCKNTFTLLLPVIWIIVIPFMWGVNPALIKSLKLVQNTAARLLKWACRHEHIKPNTVLPIMAPYALERQALFFLLLNV